VVFCLLLKVTLVIAIHNVDQLGIKKLIKKILWFWDVFWCERKVMFFHG
jgi:hypothetical protein